MKKITNDQLNRLTPKEFAETEKLKLTVILEDVRSLHNVGSFFRTCDAFGIEQIILCGITATPPNKEIHKTALGAENTVTWQYFEKTSEAISDLRNKGYEIVAVEQVEGAVMLDNLVVQDNKKYVLIFGNEVEGVQQATLHLCDSAIEIPQVGTKHSLNVAVSGGVVLWSFFSSLNKIAP